MCQGRQKVPKQLDEYLIFFLAKSFYAHGFNIERRNEFTIQYTVFLFVLKEQ